MVLSHDEEAGPFAGRVDVDAVFAYARAANDLNPRYLEGEAVPPPFTATLIRSALVGAANAPGGMEAVEGHRGGVHGEHDIFVHGPIVPGQHVLWEGSLAGLKQNSGGVILTRRIVVSDTEGRPLVEHLWSDFLLGATIRGPHLASELPDHTFPEHARARPAGVQRVPVDRDQAFRYAGVSQDHAPHAMDDEMAQLEGHPGKILQGLCTFALVSGAVVDLAAAGEPRRVRRIAGRFSAPAFPGRELTVHLYDAGRTPEGARAFAFEGVQGGIAVLRHGRVEVGDERIR